MRKNEKIGIGLALLALLILIIFVGFSTTSNEIKLKGGGIRLPPTYLNQNEATSTPTFLATGATTTMPFSSNNADVIDLNIELTSSSTIPTLTWQYEFANNAACTTSGWANCDWHAEDGNTVTSNILVTHGANPLLHQWTPPATTTDGEIWKKNVQIPSTAAKYTRISFSIGSGAVADIWAEAIPRIRTSR